MVCTVISFLTLAGARRLSLNREKDFQEEMAMIPNPSGKNAQLLQLIFFQWVLYFPSRSDAANILALVVTPSPSRHIWNRELMLELATRGHNVTVVSPDSEKKKVANHTHILLDGMYEEVHENFDYVAMSEETTFQNIMSIFQWGIDGCKRGLQSTGAAQLRELTGKQSFDHIIVESVLNECFLGFVPLFGSPPMVAITAYSNPPWTALYTGNPTNPAYVSDSNLPYSDDMTYFERAANFLIQTATLLCRTYYHMPEQNKLVQKFLGETVPSLKEIERNITVTLVNIYHSIDYPRPFLPDMIPVGGLHIQSPKPLPKDLQQYLDSASEGAILFSLGTNVQSDQLGQEKLQAFLDAFAELPQKVLWKFESDSLLKLPKNVIVAKWLPQNDILAHHNLKLFVTHAGLLSTQEAVYHGVPMVGIPFLADQFMNIAKTVQRGVAEVVYYPSLTKKTFLEAVQNVLNDPGYKERMRALSTQFRDRPQPPLYLAVWWIEYVLRHKGALHLRSAARNLTWYQYFLLDVIGGLTAGAILLVMLLHVFARWLRKACSNSDLQTKKKQ